MKPATMGKKLKQRLVYGLLAVGVVAVSWSFYNSFGGGSDSPEPAAAAPVAVKSGGKSTAKLEALDPRLRLDLLANAEDIKYEGRGKNIFTDMPESVPEVKISPLMVKQQQAQALQAQAQAEAMQRNTPPQPPPITLKFFGITNARGDKPRAFLSQNDDVWIAREGDVVNRHYKIIRISPTFIEVEDLLNNNRQNIRLTEG
jgi:hypothetical protein